MVMGVSSCNKERSVLGPEKVIVPHAVVKLSVTERSAATKANIDGTTLNWQAGDQILMASNGQMNGILFCTEEDNGTGTFEGAVSQFDPNSVNFFFLGNNTFSGLSSVSLDFSTQTGKTSTAAAKYTFLKIMDVKLQISEGGDNKNEKVYEPVTSPTVEQLKGIKFLTLTFKDLPDSPMKDGEQDVYGVKPTKVSIDGLKSIMKLDLTTGTFTAEAQDKPTVIAPASALDYAEQYVMAILPQNATGVAMTVDFTGADYAQKTWSGINWNVDSENDEDYITNWALQSLSQLSYTGKNNYGVGDVEKVVEDNPTGDKDGYKGGNVDGSKDDDRTSKDGYRGGDVYKH